MSCWNHPYKLERLRLAGLWRRFSNGSAECLGQVQNEGGGCIRQEQNEGRECLGEVQSQGGEKDNSGLFRPCRASPCLRVQSKVESSPVPAARGLCTKATFSPNLDNGLQASRWGQSSPIAHAPVCVAEAALDPLSRQRARCQQRDCSGQWSESRSLGPVVGWLCWWV